MRTTPIPLAAALVAACVGGTKSESDTSTSIAPVMPPPDSGTTLVAPMPWYPPDTAIDTGTVIAPMPWTPDSADTGTVVAPMPAPDSGGTGQMALRGLSPLPPVRVDRADR